MEKVNVTAECPDDAVQTARLNGQNLQLHRTVKDQSREAHLQPGYCRKAKCEFESHRSDKKVENKFYCAKRLHRWIGSLYHQTKNKEVIMKFNLKMGSKAKQTVNYEGEKAFVLTPQLELYAAVATAALSDQFYEKATDKLQRLRDLIAKNDASQRRAAEAMSARALTPGRTRKLGGD